MSIFYILYAKRPLDIILSALLLVLLAPLLLLVAMILYWQEGRPIWFCQARPGLNEKPFVLIKFRTMRLSGPGAPDPVSDAGRVTKLGLFLRKTSIDELPELVNVLKGDMSLVGPRPLLIRYLPFFRPAERVRFHLRPGITGLAQIQGRNSASWDQRLEADIRYYQTLGFWTDLSILFRTVAKVLCRQGVEGEPSTTMLNLDQERSDMHLKPTPISATASAASPEAHVQEGA